tara:strand:- start:1067 stop:1213 length:147 start_codon:yes stop_codon:yes gene_type:complete
MKKMQRLLKKSKRWLITLSTKCQKGHSKDAATSMAKAHLGNKQNSIIR